MGLILDTSILVASERGGVSVQDILYLARAQHGETDVGLSAVSAVELTHGIFRARSEADCERRRIYVEKALHDLIVYPVTLEIAQLAGRVEGEQAARGQSIAFEDLVIGATAYLGFDVTTLNAKHFRAIPNLKVVAL